MKIAFFTTMQRCGNSMVARIPKDVRTLVELNQGDIIRVEIQKVEKIDTNIHVDYAALTDPEARDQGIYQEA